MKRLLGYFTKEGKYIGTKLDTVKRKDFIVLMADIKKKIAEHEGQNPFRKKKYDRHQVLPYTKTYCDTNRAIIYADVFKNGKKSETIRKSFWSYAPRNDRDITLNMIAEYIDRNHNTLFPQELGIEYIFTISGMRIEHNINGR